MPLPMTSVFFVILVLIRSRFLVPFHISTWHWSHLLLHHHRLLWLWSTAPSPLWHHHQIAWSSLFTLLLLLFLLTHLQKLLISQVITVVHLLSLSVSSSVLLLVLLLFWLNINKKIPQSQTNSECLHTKSNDNLPIFWLPLLLYPSFLERFCTIYDLARIFLCPSCRIPRTNPEIKEKNYLVPGDHFIHCFVIRNLIYINVFFILAGSFEHIFDLLSSFSFTTAQVVQTTLDEKLVQVHFERGFLKNSFFDRSVSNESENDHFLFLTDSVCSVLGLKIHLWVPIRVKDDDSISSLQVKTQTTGSGTQEENIVFGVWFIEKCHSVSSVIGLGATIKPQMFDSLVVEINLHDIHQMGHLSEDQHSVVESLEFRQEPVKDLKFSRTSENPVMISDIIIVTQE